MALPVIAGVYRCALSYRDAGGATAANIFHLKQGSGTALTPAAVGTAISQAWTANQNQLMATTSGINLITVTPLDGSTASSVTPVSGSKWQGQAGGNPIPAQAAVLFIRTALRGPRNRGRLFLPFVAEGITNAGVLDPINTALVAGGWATFLNALGALTPALTLGVASYAGASFNPVASFGVENVAATQRRRQSRLR